MYPVKTIIMGNTSEKEGFSGSHGAGYASTIDSVQNMMSIDRAMIHKIK
jgi:hypothetical protein